MNILILTNEYPNLIHPKKNSPWTVPYIAREWAKNGHNVVAIVNTTKFPSFYYFGANIIKPFLEKKYNMIAEDISDRSWAKKFSFIDEGVRAFNLPMLKFFPSTNFPVSFINKQFKSIISTLASIDFVPDVITGHWINPQLHLISLLGPYYSCKTAFVFEGDFRKKFLNKYKPERFLTSINRIGCRSKYASKFLLENLNLDVKPFICVSGVPSKYIASFEELKKFSGEKITVFSAGRLVGLKNFDALILGCKKAFISNEFSLKIAGEGSEKNHLQEIIDSNNLNESVFLLGKIERHLLFDHYLSSDIFVLISSNEAFGIVYLEAMSKGCIVVASRNGGIDGIVEDGVNGFLCRDGDADELASILIRIKNLSFDERNRISRNALLTALKYSDENAAKMYLDDITR